MRPALLAAALALTLAAPAAESWIVTDGGTLQAQNTRRSRDRDIDEEYRSRIDTTFAFGRNGVVDLSLVSGEIVVTGWDRGEVKINATSERGLVRLDASPSRVSLEVRSDRGRLGDTHYELSVPKGTRVIARAVSGDIEISGTNGELEAGSVSGDVTVSDGNRRVSASSVSGSVSVTGVDGDLEANSVSGDVEVSRVTGDVTSETVSGELTLRNIRSQYVRAETVSGTIEFDGSVDANGRYEFHSHSGDIELAVPSTLNATIAVETFSGSIQSDFQIRLQPGELSSGQQRRFEFTVGGGGARITAETFSGSINIRNNGGGR